MATTSALFESHADSDPDIVMHEALETVREHLSMDISYMAELIDNTVHYRRVSDPKGLGLIDVTGSRPISELYCGYMLEGKLPRMMPHVSETPLARDLPITKEMGVESHVSVPLFRSNGDFYGTFCCFSQSPKPSLNGRDYNIATMFANFAGKTLNKSLETANDLQKMAERIAQTITTQNFAIYWQPIVDLKTNQMVGVEALSRFESDIYLTPDIWFADAKKVGLQCDLEIATIRAALSEMPLLPPHIYISLNASPDTIVSGHLTDVLKNAPTDRIIIEITEHDAIEDHVKLLKTMAELRMKGVRFAIDDLGAGYSGLSTVLRLRPDIMKLDRALVAGIHVDPARQSLATAMIHFATEIGASLIAEGVEHPEERDALRKIGVRLVQGFLFARPAPLGKFWRPERLQEVG
ncbi:MAG: EAL domain-containing protein [Yoonia sp.]|nr:EAL domain-containing protein [Yoonia sp.]